MNRFAVIADTFQAKIKALSNRTNLQMLWINEASALVVLEPNNNVVLLSGL
ncbi:MAG: hypothetical protein DHS20C06_09980 [Hyphobacterium sp.]|nr:MAG: hypothetical protein DHS20C06_09980 [Hyphobacterium sp.]